MTCISWVPGHFSFVHASAYVALSAQADWRQGGLNIFVFRYTSRLFQSGNHTGVSQYGQRTAGLVYHSWDRRQYRYVLSSSLLAGEAHCPYAGAFSLFEKQVADPYHSRVFAASNQVLERVSLYWQLTCNDVFLQSLSRKYDVRRRERRQS